MRPRSTGLRQFATILAALLVATLPLAGAAVAKSKHCPPGLAKKSVPCVPPGQVGKSHGHGWDVGDRFDRDEVHWISRPGLYGLPPLPPGQRYIVLGNRVYAVDAANYQILSMLQVITAILD